MQKYHYIFTGSGLSALMTVYQMMISNQFTNKKILLIDADAKMTNDRTWCFWELKKEKSNWKHYQKGDSLQEIVSKKWNSALFANEHFRRNFEMKPYQYQMVRGVDFYNLIFDLIAKQNYIHFLHEKVVDFQDLGSHCVVKTEKKTLTCDKVFNSIYTADEVKNQTKFPLLQQHFIGWFVKTATPVFNENSATFMDFSVNQKGNTRFMYVLPTSATEALLEYTLFSKNLLPKEEYEAEIQQYMKNLGITEYEIMEKEQGNIPMTCYPFWKHNTKNIVNIGSAGGWTKASTGYTFKNAFKKSKSLVQFLEKNISTSHDKTDFRKFHRKDKFWFYDLLLLDILDQQNHLGSSIFSSMFQSGNPAVIFKFLDKKLPF